MPTSAPPAALAVRTLLTVRFRDCDPLGHVNNAVYLTYFEMARVEFWQTVMQPARPADWPFILAEATVTFRSPAKFGERLFVEVAVDSVGNRSWVFRYRMSDEATQREVATGRTVQVAYDYEAHQSMPIPDDIRRKLQAFLEPSSVA